MINIGNFVMAETQNGPRIVKIVESDNVNIERYHWTLEQLETEYMFASANAEYNDHQSSLPQYVLKHSGNDF